MLHEPHMQLIFSPCSFRLVISCKLSHKYLITLTNFQFSLLTCQSSLDWDSELLSSQHRLPDRNPMHIYNCAANCNYSHTLSARSNFQTCIEIPARQLCFHYDRSLKRVLCVEGYCCASQNTHSLEIESYFETPWPDIQPWCLRTAPACFIRLQILGLWHTRRFVISLQCCSTLRILGGILGLNPRWKTLWWLQMAPNTYHTVY